MYKRFLILFSLFVFHSQLLPTYITYEFPHTIGRFGDQLITWLKAFRAQHCTGRPFVYVPFVYSNEMRLHGKGVDRPVDCRMERVNTLDKINVSDDKILYTLDYNFQGDGWGPIVTNEEWKHFDIMFTQMKHDRSFYQKAKEEIRLIDESCIVKPKNKNSVKIAVHVRTGGDYEPDKTWPHHRYLRFLPIQYYASQIKYMAQYFKNRKIYVYIFTDDTHPEEIVDTFKKVVPSKHVTWDYRKTGNHHDTNVVEDMWSMAQFDCLIRPWSQLSRIAEFLGDPKLVTFPVEHKDEKDEHIITFQVRRKSGKDFTKTVSIKKDEDSSINFQ